MQKRWQDGKRFAVFIDDYNGHRFQAVAYIADAFKVGKALRVMLKLETPCPYGCWIPSTTFLCPGAVGQRVPVRAVREGWALTE